MQFLIDADFLIALIKEDDKNHSRSIKKLESFRNVLVFITPFTIPETATVLSYKVSHQAARKFLKEARKKFTELSLNNQIISMADEIFLAQNKKRTSWIDCLNIAVIRYYNLDGILSYDKFYSRVGIKSVLV